MPSLFCRSERRQSVQPTCGLHLPMLFHQLSRHSLQQNLILFLFPAAPVVFHISSRCLPLRFSAESFLLMHFSAKILYTVYRNIQYLSNLFITQSLLTQSCNLFLLFFCHISHPITECPVKAMPAGTQKNPQACSYFQNIFNSHSIIQTDPAGTGLQLAPSLLRADS